jgi:TetR/AcrR family transcriptional regulator, regulator of cefoperazone and chloramphenicol sensitivity
MLTPSRAVRTGSQRTRREILLTASRLFAESGYAGVSIQDVASSAGVFPNQITYYFGGKDGLFIEAAGRLILEAGQSAETAAQKGKSVSEYINILARIVLGPGLPAVIAFVEAMLIARRRPDLAPQIKRTLDRLRDEGTRALTEVLAKKRWRLKASAAVTAQSFWATITGVALQNIASGTTSVFDEFTAFTLVKISFDDGPGDQQPASRRRSS